MSDSEREKRIGWALIGCGLLALFIFFLFSYRGSRLETKRTYPADLVEQAAGVNYSLYVPAQFPAELLPDPMGAGKRDSKDQVGYLLVRRSDPRETVIAIIYRPWRGPTDVMEVGRVIRNRDGRIGVELRRENTVIAAIALDPTVTESDLWKIARSVVRLKK
jgi:hypothetical protein